MEIIDEEDEEIKQLMIRISRKEITLCDSCDTFFDYVPQKSTCDECKRVKKREYRQRPEVKERDREYRQRPEVKERRRKWKREYNQLPEVKERNREKARKRYQRPEVKEQRREYEQRPEVKERRREYYQRPEVKERKRKWKREYYHRLKKLREEE